MAAAAATGNKKLSDCPTNVKEALEWLAALADVNGASQCAQVIKEKKIIGDNSGLDGNKAKGVCSAAKNFLSAIKNGSSSTYKDNGWDNICKDAASGGKCCGNNPACSDCTDASSCTGCCAKCPKQICARIFCLIVPVLAYVLKYLSDKCKQGGSWASQKLNGNGGKTDLKNFMELCGFNQNDLNTTTGYTLAHNTGSLTALGGALWSIKGAIETALQNDSNDPSKNFLNGASPASNKKPSTLTDLLLWLQFLPYCSQYGEVLKQVKEKLNGNNENFVTYLKESISELPMLFLQIEGPGKKNDSSPVHGSSLFLKISELSKCQYIFHEDYYKDNEKVAKMLLSVFPVIHWGLTAVKDKCKTSSCNNTITSCTATKNLLTSLGWNGSKESQKADEFPPIINDKTKCKDLKDYLTKQLLGSNDSLGGMKSILESAWQKENGPKGFDTQGQYLPQTIYEMLIWLMGLPVSEKFSELKTQIQSLNNGVQLNDVMPEFTKILFQVPHLFLALNGDLSGMLSSMFQCHGISDSSNAYQYGNNGSECLKIFSAIVAILYPVIRYLQQRCKDGDVFKNGDSWHGKQIHTTGPKEFLNFAGFQPVSTTFQQKGSEFHSTVLQPIFGDLTQNGGKDAQLNKLYDCAKEHLKKQSSNGQHTPTTIRQMMLWLIGLPVTTQYSNGGNGLIQHIQTQAANITDLSTKITNGKPTSFQHQLHHSIVGMMTVISQIEGGLKSVVEFLKEGFKDTNGSGGSSGAQGFKYESDTSTLFQNFTSYVTSVHVQLRFLYVMCGRQKDQGGWQECKYANGTCQCNGNVASCLKDFLQNGNSGSGSGTNVFKLMNGDGKTEDRKMGFNAYSPQSSSINGDSIHIHLEHMLDDINTQSSGTVEFKKPLSLLTQYCVAIGRIDPDSLGDHFDVFRELANGMWSKIESEVKESLQGIRKEDTDGSTAATALQTALKAVWPGDHKEHNDDSADLRSLTGCAPSSSNCSPFLASLSHGLYSFFDPTKLGSPAQKIDWLYMKMSSLYGKLTALKTEMETNCKCCPEGTEASSSTYQGITQCANCLPLMYKMGLVCGNAKELAKGTKKCLDLMDMMEKVLEAATSKLCLLFTKIEDGRFKPYLLFSAMVVKEKNLGKGTDENYNCYTYALGGEYTQYLQKMQEEEKNKADGYKTARDNVLKCTCSPHSYSAPAAGSGTATVVTLTLYFQGTNITAIQLVVPHHGPTYNPLVRFYPRNLKSIVDWLLRIGQTRLGQDGSAASMDELCKTFWPNIRNQLNAQDQKMFKALVEGVIKLMGLESKGNKEVEKEITEKLAAVKKNIQEKLNDGNGIEGFDKTFDKILNFKPKDYIDKVIANFGQKPSTLEGKDSNGKRSFECISKAVNKCMSTALEQIKNLARNNKTTMDNYSVTLTDLTESIQDVSELTSIEDLKTLCEGFKSFHTAYKKVLTPFNSHKDSVQNGEWQKINKCVEAFNELGQCANDLQALNSMSTAEKMTEASKKLEKLYDKLQDIQTKLNGGDIEQLRQSVDEFIGKLDGVLKEKGSEELEKALAEALKGKDSSVTTFEQFFKYYVSNVIQEMKKQNGENNTVCDIHLRVRNDLQQLSECLKVMCEVCSTGMNEFANTLKECVWETREKMKDIDKAKTKLEKLKEKLQQLNNGSNQSNKTDNMTKSIKYIRSLLRNTYIYQTQPIVDTLIDTNAVKNMTTYLKSLPDLIRDRYVLQKWKDDAAYFCGVQGFKDGIVKNSDTEEIKKKLQELLRDTYHNATEVTIHDFQVRYLIYNFCHKEGMEKIKVGLEAMESVKKALENGNVDWSSITSKKQELSPLLTKLSENAYLKYFATHPRHSRTYYYLCNRGITHPLSTNLVNAKTIDNYTKATK